MADFTYFSEYMDRSSGVHLKQEKVNTMIDLNNDFHSLNRLKSLRTSRKDDLIMLCYLLIYLSNLYEMPDLVFPAQTDYNYEKRLYFIQSYKKSYTLEKMCKYS